MPFLIIYYIYDMNNKNIRKGISMDSFKENILKENDKITNDPNAFRDITGNDGVILFMYGSFRIIISY